MRFIRRSEPDHSMVSVRLRSIEGLARGEVFLPMRQRGEALTTQSSPEGGALSAVEALGLATAHAFEFRTDIAVVDEEALWRREWGTLHSDRTGETDQAGAGDAAGPAEAEEGGIAPETETVEAEIAGNGGALAKARKSTPQEQS